MASQVTHLLRYEEKDGQLRTSHGLTIPEGDVRDAWPNVLAAMQAFIHSKDPLSFRIGPYHCVVNHEPYLTVDCHKFPLLNICDVADDMGLDFDGKWDAIYSHNRLNNLLYRKMVRGETE